MRVFFPKIKKITYIKNPKQKPKPNTHLRPKLRLGADGCNSLPSINPGPLGRFNLNLPMGGGLGTIGGSMVVPAGAAGWGGELPGGPGGGLILILWGFS